MTARKWTRRVVAIATLTGAAVFGVIEAVPAAAAPSAATCQKLTDLGQAHIGVVLAETKACGGATPGGLP